MTTAIPAPSRKWAQEEDIDLSLKRPATWAEHGLVPDCVTRMAIRSRLKDRLRSEAMGGGDVSIDAFVIELEQSAIAEATERANDQHYELPSSYFEKVLGPRRKYSSTIWPGGVNDLAESEEVMLKLTAERAAIVDGDRILELGCGWGSFTLWAAEHFPNSSVIGVSNSYSQRAYILSEAERRGLSNVSILTANMNEFEPEGRFDRIVSIEMFEHMRNYGALMERISKWLTPTGSLFVHIFTHKRYAYPFIDTDSDDDWMAHYFFAGGTMPSDDLLLRFQDDLKLEGHWRVNGVNYSRTLEAWLQEHDRRRKEIMPIFEQVYGSAKAAKVWFNRWRLFYLACSELFAFKGGNEWQVSHYRFSNRGV